VDDQRVGRLVRALRRRRGWRQLDLAVRAGVSQPFVSELGHGRVSRMSVRAVRRVASALDASLELQFRGLGADVDRLLDERHARLVEATLRYLGAAGWLVRPEVSYSEWGERGSIDLLGWHPPTRSLLVVEVKTELASMEETLRKHDEKVRLGGGVAGRRLGWSPQTISRLLVLPATRTTRRDLAAHAAVVGSAYPTRGRRVGAWLSGPNGELSGLLLVPEIDRGHAAGRRSGVQRVRVAVVRPP
jgi:transcriptional regulator with XRE-family HTH domain